MNVHKNARLTPAGRALLAQRVESGWPMKAAAQAAGVSRRTGYKWLGRHRLGGERRHYDRSSAPRRCPRETPKPLLAEIERLRRERLTGPVIAARLGMARSTVGLILRRMGLGKLSALEPRTPVIRYERAAPGEMIHLDIKKLGRFWRPGHRVTGDRQGASEGAGWEFVHLAIDDHSRVAFGTIEGDERGSSACRALLQALRYYRGLGVTFTRVMTDNGACYKSRRFRRLLRRLGLRHLRTRPYTPRTNGKAERLVQTALREWAYARSYDSSEQRRHALPRWLHQYNWHRPHASLGYQPPISRIQLPLNNVLGLHT